MTDMPQVPDEVTTAASVVAMQIVADHLHTWHDHLDLYAATPPRELKGVIDENWLLVLQAIKNVANATQPERKLYDSAVATLLETAQDAAAVTKGVV